MFHHHSHDMAQRLTKKLFLEIRGWSDDTGSALTDYEKAFLVNLSVWLDVTSTTPVIGHEVTQLSEHLQWNQLMSQVRGGICLHLSLPALHTGITHSFPDMWLATPALQCGWQCVCHAHAALLKTHTQTHPSLCSHADSHISWFLKSTLVSTF